MFRALRLAIQLLQNWQDTLVPQEKMKSFVDQRSLKNYLWAMEIEINLECIMLD